MIEVIMWVTLGILVLVISLIVWMEFKYKYKVTIKELANGRKIIYEDKARDYKAQDGKMWWQLKKEKDKEKKLMPVPPSEAVEVTKKGKKFVEVYRTETGEYIFSKDITEIREIPRNLFKPVPKEIEQMEDDADRDEAYENWKAQKLADWQQKEGVTMPYRPLSQNQRLALINNIERAHTRKGKSWKENVPMIVGLGAAVVLIVALMIFWGDIAKPVLDGKAMNRGIIETQERTLQLLKDIEQGVQTIESQQQEQGQRIDNLEKQQGPPN